MDKSSKTKWQWIGAIGALLALGGIGLAAFGLPDRSPMEPPQNDMVMDASMRRAVVDSLIAKLDRHYVDADKAAGFGPQLRARMQRGAFDSITSASALAGALTKAMRQDLHDKHLEMRYFEKVIPEAVPGQAESPEDAAADFAERRRFNFGFAAVSRLRGNIGYLDLREFGRLQHVADRIAAAMTMLSDTQALIIDLRHNHGGDPDSVTLMASYLFDKRTHLNDIWWRETGQIEERWTSEQVPGTRYGESRPVYLLTSEETFSAGEDFAYALKNTGRATLVGEVTGGGAHPGDRHRLTGHFMVNIPTGRTISPVTHTDWEGVGVVPDLSAPEKKALEVAQIAILKRLIAAEKDPDWRRRLTQRLDELT